MSLNELLKIVQKIIKDFQKEPYCIKVIKNNSDSVEKIFSFRYNIYCLVDKLLKKEDYPDKKEFDEFDKYSVFLVAFNKSDEIIGLLRVVKYSKHTFPTIEEFKLDNALQHIKKDKTVEISRFMIRPDYRKTLLIYYLYKAAFIYSKKHGINFWIGCVEDWFLKSFKGILGDIKMIGEPVFCFNAVNYPFIINLNSLEEKLKLKDKFFYYLLKHKTKKIKV